MTDPEMLDALTRIRDNAERAIKRFNNDQTIEDQLSDIDSDSQAVWEGLCEESEHE